MVVYIDDRTRTPAEFKDDGDQPLTRRLATALALRIGFCDIIAIRSRIECDKQLSNHPKPLPIRHKDSSSSLSTLWPAASSAKRLVSVSTKLAAGQSFRFNTLFGKRVLLRMSNL